MKKDAFTLAGTTYVNLPQIIAKAGFTLAEVLITLGIIGVVAAMTIPSLMAHFQKEQTVTKLKKAISVINQAYRLSYDDVGEPESAFALGAEEYFKQYWAPYIKVLSYCSKPEECGYKSLYPWKYYNKKQVDICLIAPTARTTFYSMDGVLYVILTTAGDMTQPNHNIYIDINGGAGPNIMGRDVFVLTCVQKDGGGVRPYGYEKTNAQINTLCSKTGGSGSVYCAEKILRAGWKIETDSPW